MAKLLFRLRNVPEDEAAEVRSLLEEHGIDFYETSPGNWGISMPGLWLRDETRLEEAKGLISEYQARRREQARAEYMALREAGQQPTLFDSFRRHPLRFISYSAIALIIVYLSVSIFYQAA